MREKYQLNFSQSTSGAGRLEFECWTENAMFYDIARKINQMHIEECKYLVEQIEFAEANKEFDDSILLDHDDFTDEDGLEIIPPNVVINKKTKVPLDDMKLIMREWIYFVHVSSLHDKKKKKPGNPLAIIKHLWAKFRK